ncbi:MAG TPA: GNAT family N-acetyltransferase [Streptosporangiaceae bacterium]
MARADRTPVVGLATLDDAALEELVAHAVPDTALEDVMPVAPGPAEWTSARLQAFIEFHRGRRGGLDGPAREVSFAVRVDGMASGVVRLQRVSAGALEVGMWLARSARGHGVGGQVLVAAAQRAAELGARKLVAETTAGNLAALAALQRAGARISSPSETGAVHAELDLARFTGS